TSRQPPERTGRRTPPRAPSGGRTARPAPPRAPARYVLKPGSAAPHIRRTGEIRPADVWRILSSTLDGASLHSPVVIDGVVHLLSAVIVPLYDLCSCGCVGWVRKVASRPVITEHLEIGGRSLPAVDHYRDVVFRSGSAVARWGGEPAGERSHEELGEAERGEAAGGGRKAADEQQHDGGERQRCEDAEAETRGPED